MARKSPNRISPPPIPVPPPLKTAKAAIVVTEDRAARPEQVDIAAASSLPDRPRPDAPRPDASLTKETDHFVPHRLLCYGAVPSWLVSMVFHLITLLILALIYLPEGSRELITELTLGSGGELESLDELEDELIPALDLGEPVQDVPPPSETDAIPAPPVVAPPDDLDAASDPDPASLSEEAPRNEDLLQSAGDNAGDALRGRGEAMRAKLVRQAGGTTGSEKSVALALQWLARHQNPDGSWSFDHRGGDCRGRCKNEGQFAEAQNAATALALLPFLGAGQTHKTGEYQERVRDGLKFLRDQIRIETHDGERTGNFLETRSRMYAHSLVTIVLCEAYGMTRDRDLAEPAQLALNYIAYAQDPAGGGWKYGPREPGDTSVLGWQLMAIKSGQMAYLHVPPHVIQGAVKFLDATQARRGARYGYSGPNNAALRDGVVPGPGSGKAATTSIGLLCRMYLGAKREQPGMEAGVTFLSTLGPSRDNMYYNYYATQVLRHYEGNRWKKWNATMRDYLVESQAGTGHESGSWFFKADDGDHGTGPGGRLYYTALATMILEVYYRHLPLYSKDALEGGGEF